MTDQIDFAKMNGLVPAVVQHSDDGTVLMVGFMNKEALDRTVKERQVVFWSRSKQRLWKKGETSGNFLDVVSIDRDCDNDALLITASPRGPVCHTGSPSCFAQKETAGKYSVLTSLIETIKQRKKDLPEDSYTTKLFTRGPAFIGQKVGEEAVELAIAAQYNEKQRCIEEAADLIYHLLVLLREKGIEFSEVTGELEARVNAPHHP
jgi:phosphoribosyl-ATP pyrophosphohydrolase/phosphoribosyl-AMP cyclohydrolase